MIAIDTSSMQRLLRGEKGIDTAAAHAAASTGDLVLPPIVVTEVLSYTLLRVDDEAFVLSLPLLDIKPGYWERAGRMRRTLLALGQRAGLADCLIAQCCIDEKVPLITYDRDFRHFVRAGLQLM